MEISKKLLNEVLNETITKHNPAFKEIMDNCIIDNGKNLMINYKTTKGYILGYIINIYELSNKCKEWVNKQSSENLGYAIKTVHYGNNVVGGFVGIKDSYIDDCKTEYELVFKLCQWILENKGIK